MRLVEVSRFSEFSDQITVEKQVGTEASNYMVNAFFDTTC